MVAALETSPGLFDALRALGTGLAITEIGTGHSTLSMFQQVHAGVVRIHPRYCHAASQDAPSAALLDALVHFCLRLGVETTLDGSDGVLPGSVAGEPGVLVQDSRPAALLDPDAACRRLGTADGPAAG